MKYSTWDKLYLIGLGSGLLLSLFVVLVFSVLLEFVYNTTNQEPQSQIIVTPTQVESKEKVQPFVMEKPSVKVVVKPTPVVKEPVPVVKVISEPTPVVKDSVIFKQDTTK